MALNYSAEATDDDGSCMYCTLSASVAVSDVSCAGADDGLVTVLASGALPDSSALVYTLLPLDIQQSDSFSRVSPKACTMW